MNRYSLTQAGVIALTISVLPRETTLNYVSIASYIKTAVSQDTLSLSHDIAVQINLTIQAKHTGAESCLAGLPLLWLVSEVCQMHPL